MFYIWYARAGETKHQTTASQAENRENKGSAARSHIQMLLLLAINKMSTLCGCSRARNKPSSSFSLSATSVFLSRDLILWFHHSKSSPVLHKSRFTKAPCSFSLSASSDCAPMNAANRVHAAEICHCLTFHSTKIAKPIIIIFCLLWDAK